MTTLLDIGCNTLGGYEHLQQYENITGSDIRKIFIEPNPECWAEIEQRLASIPKATLVKKAISSTEGTVELITRADVTADIAATIIGKDYLEASLAKCNMFVNDFNRYKIESITIKKIIDEFNIIPGDTILKLDAEGVEYDILSDIIRNNINFKKIYCEFHIHNDVDMSKKISLLKEFADRNLNIIDWQ
jgi:FkbM family methyltransferase